MLCHIDFIDLFVPLTQENELVLSVPSIILTCKVVYYLCAKANQGRHCFCKYLMAIVDLGVVNKALLSVAKYDTYFELLFSVVN